MSFKNRDERLKRRQESNDFKRVFQPLSLFFGFFGLLGMLWTAFSLLAGEKIRLDVLGASLTLLSFPVLIFFYRLLRGHFSKDLYR